MAPQQPLVGTSAGEDFVSRTPTVSVVMSVYNGAATLAETLSSVLAQEDCSFEFIVIDDGSSDGAARILDEFADRDARLRVVHQQNTGLTPALIRGCAMATGEFIARQDAGDISLPGRLSAQSELLRARTDVVMVASAVAVCGPQNEPLYSLARPSMELDSGLRRTEIDAVRGPPHHGATMFRRDAYLHVGGYRAPFVVAQDLDLWLRLIEQGTCLGMEQVFYQARLEPGSISSRRRDDQFRMALLALQCARARASIGDDASVLADVVAEPAPKRPLSAGERSRFHYFVASCLRKNDPQRARAYFGKALRDNPLHLKALIHWVLAK
jgi:glycosyltransferase involved in cell wall biosynthesis